MLYEDSRYIQSILRETDFWLRMSRLICDAGLFMFQSRSQWQFIWRTHKKAKYLVKYRWFLGISGWRVTCRGVNIYWMQSLRLETEAECCADTRQCVLGAEQTTVRARREERDSVGVRSVRELHHMCHVTHHVSSQVLSLLVTCHNCEVWLKLSQVVINLSLWMWQEEFANKTFPHLSIESQHIKQWGQQRQCVSGTRDIDNNLRERRAGVIFISDGTLWLLYNTNTHYIRVRKDPGEIHHSLQNWH